MIVVFVRKAISVLPCALLVLYVQIIVMFILNEKLNLNLTKLNIAETTCLFPLAGRKMLKYFKQPDICIT